MTTWWLGLAALAVLMVGLLLVLLWWLQGLRRQTELALGPDAMRLQAQLLQGLQALARPNGKTTTVGTVVAP